MSNYANELNTGASDKINTADGAMPNGLDHVMSEVSAAWQMPSRQQNSAESIALPNDTLQQQHSTGAALTAAHESQRTANRSRRFQ